MVAKVLPYGAEWMGEEGGGGHQCLESSYSEFRIHTTRRDGVNNSLLSSSLPSRTHLFFHLPSSQPPALM